MPTAYEHSSRYSECRLGKLRDRLSRLPLDDAAALVCGSYARREASEHSDIDFFVMSRDTSGDQPPIEKIRSEIRKIGPNEPSKDGAFGVEVNREEILRNISFRHIKNEGHHFTRELLKVFESTFDSTHPIRRAVVF